MRAPRNVHGIEIDKLFMKDPQISSLSIVSRVEKNYVRRKKIIVNGQAAKMQQSQMNFYKLKLAFK